MLSEEKEVWLRAYCAYIIADPIHNTAELLCAKANQALESFKRKFPSNHNDEQLPIDRPQPRPPKGIE